MITCKLNVTTRCNSECMTCPAWEYDGQDMSLATFRFVWERLMDDPLIRNVVICGTGEVYCHPDVLKILQHIESYNPFHKHICIQTNGSRMSYVPAVDEFVISFNGGDWLSYEYTTGLDFKETVANIKLHYGDLLKVKERSIHCLVYTGNYKCEKDFKKLWHDFPGKLRISYKCDNQQLEDFTLNEYKQSERCFCDYLDMLVIDPDCSVKMCCHDWHNENRFGSIKISTVQELMRHSARLAKRQEHLQGKYTGICKNCNYNVPIDNQIKWFDNNIRRRGKCLERKNTLLL